MEKKNRTFSLKKKNGANKHKNLVTDHHPSRGGCLETIGLSWRILNIRDLLVFLIFCKHICNSYLFGGYCVLLAHCLSHAWCKVLCVENYSFPFVWNNCLAFRISLKWQTVYMGHHWHVLCQWQTYYSG